MPQDGEGLRGPQLAPAGGSITVDVGPSDRSIDVSTGAAQTTTYPVPQGKSVTIPVPPVPPGTVVTITTGKGLGKRVIYVEVVALVS